MAAYRAADLARELMRRGATVRTCLTDGALRFVTPLLFETLTGEPCLVDTFEEPVPGRMAHIDWARWADVVVVAPATANTLTRLAFGHADDMLTTLVAATEAPLVLGPAMNPSMYAAANVQEALDRLAAAGAWRVDPTEGDVVSGETGPGKLASVQRLADETLAAAAPRDRLRGRHVLITTGPTQEPIDAVRYLSNRSSGKMGAALARIARQMGARVTVVAGPQRAILPAGLAIERVRTACEMEQAVRFHAATVDLAIFAAAVADYRPANPVAGKLRREAEMVQLALIANPDVAAVTAAAFSANAVRVGFAAEPGDDLEYAREKMRRKGLHAIAVNDVSQAGIGFESDDNALTLLTPSGEPQSSGLVTKLQCAAWLLDRVADLRA